MIMMRAAALWDLAREVRARLARARWVAVTGFCGKTTVKEMLARILSRRGPTVAAFVGAKRETSGAKR